MSLKSNYRDGDSFSRKSKEEGYRSRASYKLKQILDKEVPIAIKLREHIKWEANG